MEAKDIENFRKEFASIVYCKGVVKSVAKNIATLEAWNKGGCLAVGRLRLQRLVVWPRLRPNVMRVCTVGDYLVVTLIKSNKDE